MKNVANISACPNISVGGHCPEDGTYSDLTVVVMTTVLFCFLIATGLILATTALLAWRFEPLMHLTPAWVGPLPLWIEWVYTTIVVGTILALWGIKNEENFRAGNRGRSHWYELSLSSFGEVGSILRERRREGRWMLAGDDVSSIITAIAGVVFFDCTFWWLINIIIHWWMVLISGMVFLGFPLFYQLWDVFTDWLHEIDWFGGYSG